VAQFEIRRASNAQFYWVFQANNNEIVAQSETYVAKASAQNAINVLKAQARDASVIDRS
jgi:uncharacterized protein